MSNAYASQLICVHLLLPQHDIQLDLTCAYKLECPLVGCMSILDPIAFLPNKAAGQLNSLCCKRNSKKAHIQHHVSLMLFLHHTVQW